MASSAASTNVALTIEMLQNKKKHIPMNIKLHLISRNENLQALLGNILFLSKQNTDESRRLLTEYKNKFMHLIYVDLIEGDKNRAFLGIKSAADWAADARAAGLAAAGLAAAGRSAAAVFAEPAIKKDFDAYYASVNKTP
jgi:hypothetical protein